MDPVGGTIGACILSHAGALTGRAHVRTHWRSAYPNKEQSSHKEKMRSSGHINRELQLYKYSIYLKKRSINSEALVVLASLAKIRQGLIKLLIFIL